MGRRRDVYLHLRSCSVLFFSLAALALLGCGPKYLEGTEIPETPENREVADLIESYRRAMEARDVDALAALVSPEYYENTGKTSSDDEDYGYETLREVVLPLLRDNIKSVQMRIRITRIEILGERANADFEFWLRFLFTEGGREGWRQWNDYNRLELVREEGEWRIAGGL